MTSKVSRATLRMSTRAQPACELRRDAANARSITRSARQAVAPGECAHIAARSAGDESSEHSMGL